MAVFVKSGRVILTARMDLLPEVGDELAEQIDAVAKREGSQALALVAYSAAALSANRLLTRLMDRLAEHDLTDVLYVGHGRWWSLTCGDECCPLAGTPLDLTSHPLSAAAVLAGLVTRANREELEASIGGPSPAELPRLQSITETLLSEVAQFDEAGAEVRVMLSMLDTAVADPNSLDERTCLLLGLMLRRIELRDRALMLINPANADDHVRLWGAVVAGVPPTLAAAPLCLLGMAAWLGGDGALLNCCCGRLAVVAPDYSMGTLLAEISERALPPSVWQELGSVVQGRSDEQPAPLAS